MGLESAPTTLELPFHVDARSARLMLRLLSFMEVMDTHMVLAPVLVMPVLDMLVLDMPVSAMLDLDMPDLDMEESLPPTLLSVMLLLILLMELPTLPMLGCAPTTLELRFLARQLLRRCQTKHKKIYQSTWG